MNLIGFNPVEPFEAVADGRLERESAVSLMGAALSASLTMLAKLGNMPLVGKALLYVAEGVKLNLVGSTLFTKEGMRLTYPKLLDNPDLESEFVTIHKGEK